MLQHDTMTKTQRDARQFEMLPFGDSSDAWPAVRKSRHPVTYSDAELDAYLLGAEEHGKAYRGTTLDAKAHFIDGVLLGAAGGSLISVAVVTLVTYFLMP